MNAELRVEYAMDQSPRDREVELDKDIGWKMEDSQPTCCPFIGNTGLKIDLPDNPAPIDFFNYLFDAEVFEILTEQTNIYAQQRKNDDNLKPHSRLHNWSPVIVDEIKVFFALIIAMGIVRKPDVVD